MHDAGAMYLDLAPQNVLCSPATGEFCLIDVNRASVRRRQSAQAQIDNLALLQVRMPLTAAFYEGYGKEFADRAEEIAQRAQAERESIFRRLSGRWRKQEHDLVRVRVGALQWRVRRAYDVGSLTGILADPDRFCGRTSERFVVRRFDFARARRCYREAYRLELLGQACTRPVAVGEKRALGICMRSYFVSTTSTTLQSR